MNSINEISFKFLFLVILSLIAGYFKIIRVGQGIGIAVGITLCDIFYYSFKKYKQKNK
ncbi:MAG: hypothetical protein WCQ54_11350 [Clostridiaceae bacterium]